MKYLYRWSPFLIFLLLCGCSYNSYTKTVLLPAQNLDSSLQKENSDGDWELKKMYQYQYTSTNTSGWDEGLSTSIGWSGEDHTLYTLHGSSGQPVTVNKVDIRYGFYEKCADLGVLYYNHMELSPDGKYVLYSTTDEEQNLIHLFLYSISDQTTQKIAELPEFVPFLSLRFIWSRDSACFYYWYTIDTGLIEQIDKGLIDKFNLEELITYYYDLYGMSEDTTVWQQILSYDLASGQISSIYSIPLENSFSLNVFYALERELFPSSDGSKVLIKIGTNLAPLIYDKVTGQIQKIPENLFYDFGVVPEEFSYYGLTNSTIYTSNNKYESIMFLTEEKGNYIISDYMATAAYTSLQLSRGKFLISNDGKHMVDVETNDSGESLILVYNYTPNISGEPTISGGQLLYQTTDDITHLSVTPDDRYIILFTEQQLSKESVYSDSGSGSVNSEISTKEAEAHAQSYQYKITVLEL